MPDADESQKQSIERWQSEERKRVFSLSRRLSSYRGLDNVKDEQLGGEGFG